MSVLIAQQAMVGTQPKHSLPVCVDGSNAQIGTAEAFDTNSFEASVPHSMEGVLSADPQRAFRIFADGKHAVRSETVRRGVRRELPVCEPGQPSGPGGTR